jgi:hypothetical protein
VARLYDAGVYVNVAHHPPSRRRRAAADQRHGDPRPSVLDRALESFAAVKRDFESEHGPLPSG